VLRATVFMLVAVARPSTVGAIMPSSRHLAAAMARAAQGAARLVELGAGTGAITAALREQHPGVPTLAVELDRRLADQLQERFPGISVCAAPAHAVLAALPDSAAPVALVSSIPFRSLPLRLRLRSSLAIERFLLGHPQHRLVQYTYLPQVPFDLRNDGLRWRRIEWVWRNVPPACVWELQADDGTPVSPE
jgi:phosphatidylethanolamine/phosphatidyl-N-methylethanolamine N-methyltransferase